jgi:hypothetical protein
MIQLILYDAVNRNKISIRQLPFIIFLTHYMFRPLRAIFRRDIQLDIFNGLPLLQRSVAHTQFDAEMLHVAHWYFDFVFLIHVIS